MAKVDEIVVAIEPSGEMLERMKKIRDRYGEPHEGGWAGDEVATAMTFLPAVLPQQPRGVIEIGSANGVTFAAWASIIPEGLHMSIDLVDRTCGWTGRLSLAQRAANWAEDIKQNIAYIGDSRHKETVAIASAAFPHGASFLYIDGDHSYSAAREDFLNYVPLVQNGGIVGFHDVIHAGHGEDCAKVFRQLVEQTADAWLIAKGFGIGLIRVNRAIDYEKVLGI